MICESNVAEEMVIDMVTMVTNQWGIQRVTTIAVSIRVGTFDDRALSWQRNIVLYQRNKSTSSSSDTFQTFMLLHFQE